MDDPRRSAPIRVPPAIGANPRLRSVLVAMVAVMVRAFGATALGLADMGGNVWQWTGDSFRPYHRRAETPQTALFHVGFGCARDLP